MCQNSIPLSGRFLASTHFKITYKMAFYAGYICLSSSPPSAMTVSVYLCICICICIWICRLIGLFMHTSTHSTSFLFPGPFPWQSSLSLTMRIQFRPEHAPALPSSPFPTHSFCCQLQLRIRRVCRFSPQLQVLRAARGRATASG